MPGPAVSLAETSQYLVVCDNRDNVFYSSLSSSSSLTWRRASYPASEVRSSLCGEIVWRLHHHTAFCLLQPSQTWLEICRNVASLALTESSGWLVKLDGGLVLHQDLSASSPYSTRPRQIYTGHFIKEVRQWDDLLVARTSNSDLLFARLELLAEEEAWQPLLTQLTVVGFDISQAGELWVGRCLSPSWSVLTCPLLVPVDLCSG